MPDRRPDYTVSLFVIACALIAIAIGIRRVADRIDLARSPACTLHPSSLVEAERLP